MLAVLELEPEPRSVASARRWTADQLLAAGCVGPVDTVVLLVSELVTNAVVYAGTACSLTLSLGDVVRVEVRDGSDELPELDAGAAADPLASSGRGLRLVQGLSASCGAELLAEGGKRIWFEVPCPLRSADRREASPPTVATA